MYTRMLRQSALNASLTDLPPLGMDVLSLVDDFRRYYTYNLGRDRHSRSAHYAYRALVQILRDRLMERWKNTRYAYEGADGKQAYYLSLEFLMGRALGNAALNLGLEESDAAGAAVPGDGAGGAGRVRARRRPRQRRPRAAGRLLSRQLRHPAAAGHRLRHPLRVRHVPPADRRRPAGRGARPLAARRQPLGDGAPRVHPAGALRRAHRVATGTTAGALRARWVDTHDVLASPTTSRFRATATDTVNTLRLWKAAATDEFDLGEFNAGHYPESVAAKNAAENITMVLYPNDASENGKELRLRQQYFLASASLQDIVARWIGTHGGDVLRLRREERASSSTTPTRAAPSPS